MPPASSARGCVPAIETNTLNAKMMPYTVPSQAHHGLDLAEHVQNFDRPHALGGQQIRVCSNARITAP